MPGAAHGKPRHDMPRPQPTPNGGGGVAAIPEYTVRLLPGSPACAVERGNRFAGMTAADNVRKYQTKSLPWPFADLSPDARAQLKDEINAADRAPFQGYQDTTPRAELYRERIESAFTGSLRPGKGS